MTATIINRIAAGRTDLVLEFLNSGGSVTATDTKGVSLLQWCAYYGDVTALRLLLTKGEDLSHLGLDFGLNAAAFHGHWQLCQFLIENHAPINGTDSVSNETPLHSALCSEDRVRYDPVVMVLIAAGANPNAATISGKETGSFMRDCLTKGETPLHRAAAFGTTKTIQLLLDAGAKRETKDANGDSPLSWASWYRRPADILTMLCYGSFKIHSNNQSMRANLIGDPFPNNNL